MKKNKIKEKISSLGISMFILIIVYAFFILCIDKSNFFTLSGFLDAKMADRWFDFAITYGAAIMAAIFSAAVLVAQTDKQLSYQKEILQQQLDEQRKMQKEELRCSHMPYLKLTEFSKEIVSPDGSISGICLGNNNFTIKQKKNNVISIKFTNIGLDSIKGFWYELEYNNSKTIIDNVNNENEQFIEKNGTVCINNINLSGCKDKEISFSIYLYYGDLLGNYYTKEYLIHVSDLFNEQLHCTILSSTQSKILEDDEIKKRIGIVL